MHCCALLGSGVSVMEFKLTHPPQRPPIRASFATISVVERLILQPAALQRLAILDHGTRAAHQVDGVEIHLTTVRVLPV